MQLMCTHPRLKSKYELPSVAKSGKINKKKEFTPKTNIAKDVAQYMWFFAQCFY